MNIRKLVEGPEESDKRVDYLKYINTFGIGVVTLLASYMSLDIRDKNNIAIKKAKSINVYCP